MWGIEIKLVPFSDYLNLMNKKQREIEADSPYMSSSSLFLSLALISDLQSRARHNRLSHSKSHISFGERKTLTGKQAAKMLTLKELKCTWWAAHYF